MPPSVESYVIVESNVQRATMREELHGHGANGMYFYGYRCLQYPRLTKLVRRESHRVVERTTFLVDGVEVEATLAAIAQALNAPHDFDGIVVRLRDRLCDNLAITYDGMLRVEGGTAARCAKLRQSFPHFEGVAIDWRASVPVETEAV